MILWNKIKTKSKVVDRSVIDGLPNVETRDWTSTVSYLFSRLIFFLLAFYIL